MPVSTGTRLGPYEIVAAIGAGGMGEVYRARDMRLDRTVAVKVLPENRSSSPQARERFEREAPRCRTSFIRISHHPVLDELWLILYNWLKSSRTTRRLGN